MKMGKWLARFQVRLRTGCHLATCNFHVQAVVACNQSCLSVLLLFGNYVKIGILSHWKVAGISESNSGMQPELSERAASVADLDFRSFHLCMRRTCAENVQTYTHIGLLPRLIALLMSTRRSYSCDCQRHKPLWCCSSKDIKGLETSVVFCFFCAPVGVWKKRCTVGSWIVAVAAWTFAVVEGIKSYLSWSRLKLFNNKFYHCFSSSCSCNFNFCHTCHTSTLSHVLERPVLTGTVWEAGTYRSGTCDSFVFRWH